VEASSRLLELKPARLQVSLSMAFQRAPRVGAIGALLVGGVDCTRGGFLAYYAGNETCRVGEEQHG
jgi:hypothetical protein